MWSYLSPFVEKLPPMQHVGVGSLEAVVEVRGGLVDDAGGGRLGLGRAAVGVEVLGLGARVAAQEHGQGPAVRADLAVLRYCVVRRSVVAVPLKINSEFIEARMANQPAGI